MYKHYHLTTVLHPEAAERAVQWLQPQLKPDDLVVTTHLEWMLKCRTVSPMLVQLAEGGKGSTVYFEGLKKRFLFPCQLKDARFAILHEASARVASVYGVTPILQRIETEWKLVHQDETIRIYANPAWDKSS
jgi:hypothetical protein